jgi:hypothetical protein
MLETVSIFIGFFFGMMLMYVLLKFRARDDGQIVITTTEDGKRIFSLELDKDPDELELMERVTFKVTDQQHPEYDDFAT